MITAVWIVLGLWVMFVLLPAAVVTMHLFSRKDFPDFDAKPERLENSSYGPWAQEILRDAAWMRKQALEEVRITARDGVSLSGEWLCQGSGRTVIMAHGYRATPINNFSSIGRAFIERGWNVLMIWQRAQGKSGGHVTAFGLREGQDLGEWIRWVEEKNGGEIGLYGVSMGGAAVGYASDAEFAGRVRVMGIDCAYCRPYDQMLGMAKASIKPALLLLPLINLYARCFLNVNMTRDIRDSLRRTHIPAIFVGGMKDDTVSAEAVRAGYEACASEKELILVENAPHTLAFLAGGASVQKRILDFFDAGMSKN